MVAVGDEADAQVLARGEPAGLVDVVADELDVLGRAGDVAALASGTVLHEHEVPILRVRRAYSSARTPPRTTYNILRSLSGGGVGFCCSTNASSKTESAEGPDISASMIAGGSGM